MARTRNQGSKWIRPDKRLAIYLRDDCRCIYCGRDHTMGAVLTLDHVVACELSDTPDNSESNLVTSCLSCNSSKQDQTMRSWYKVLRANGFDTNKVSARIRRNTAKPLASYRRQAKLLIESMDCSDFDNLGQLAAAA